MNNKLILDGYRMCREIPIIREKYKFSSEGRCLFDRFLEAEYDCYDYDAIHSENHQSIRFKNLDKMMEFLLTYGEYIVSETN